MNYPTNKSRIRPLSAIVLIASLMGGALSALLPRDSAKRLAEEGGWFETGSAVCLAGALLVLVVQLARSFSTLRLAGAAMVLWALLRELDFQKRFTYRSVESLGYYTRPHAPWSQKLLVLLILAPFVVAGLFLVRELCRRFIPACRERQSWVCHMVAAVVLLLFASVSEKVFRLHAAEEILEAGIAFLVLMLVWESRTPPRAIDGSTTELAS